MRIIFLIVLFLLLSQSEFIPEYNNKFQVYDLCELVGYTCIECSNVVDEFEGADYDKPVVLDNGMIFEFMDYSYTYSYRPEVAIFATEFNYRGKNTFAYKLIIEDEIYDVNRLR